MRKKEIKLPLTPITEETFIRQGWKKNKVGDPIGEFGFEEGFLGGGMYRPDEEEQESFDEPDEENVPFFYSLPLPKDEDEKFAPMLVSNASDETALIKDLGLKPDTFFVELLDMNGLGMCTSEEELEILYRALTKREIEENLVKSK
jgi:hypothetical protein